MKPTPDTILEQLKSIGVVEGDVLFVTADLMRVGLFLKSRRETMKTWVDILLQAVGKEGTVVAAAYTRTFFRFKKNTEIIFTTDSPSNSGALSTALLADPRALRSLHPTSSCVAIGHNAQEIIHGHDQNSLCYSLLRKLIEYNGKHLMLGTLDRENAPLGLHYAQELMGITKTEPTVGLFQTYYIDQSGQRKLFTRWDVGGCSRGGYKMLGHLMTENAMTISLIGNAASALIDAKSATEIAMAALIIDRRAFICDNLNCLSCRGRWSVNGLATPAFYFRKYFANKIF
jgi:aminoglycoside N3'-acetyltransferase